ncbi:TetR/AcrR family transcriptional regulator [Actinomadura scrupuli]|uniref:TetR/AcrR family transcriptional regulator n=1 Tax=Actinomadura scrupuli TaxID=559629 RepID=UPI003D96E6EA
MFEDLTARARIRDAALLQFAERGVRGATIRGIAEAAGVSPGLVQHHFGSKEELRAACDTHAMEVIRRANDQATSTGMRDPGIFSVTMRATMPVRRYVARAMVDGSPAAAKLFDDLVGYSERYLADPPPGIAEPQTSDLHAYAATITALSLGIIVLHEHLSRALDVDTLTLEGYPRLGLAVLEVFTDDLLSPELVAQSRATLEQFLKAGPSSAAGDGTPP